MARKIVGIIDSDLDARSFPMVAVLVATSAFNAACTGEKMAVELDAKKSQKSANTSCSLRRLWVVASQFFFMTENSLVPDT